MHIIAAGRRRALAVAALWAMALAAPALAQDPRQNEAVAAARDWLVLLDKHDVKQLYASSGKRFKEGISEEKWAEVAESGRQQFGAVTQRSLLGAQSPPDTPNRPKGDFMTVIFRSDFAKRGTGSESLTLEREADGKWRVIGYLMK
ncbi:MAG: DUF4019 domain-containing protein [Burkholderiales bacterium]